MYFLGTFAHSKICSDCVIFISFIFLRFCGSEGKLCNDVTQFTFTTSSAHKRAILHWNEVAAGAWMPVRWLWGLEILNKKKGKRPEAPPPVYFPPVPLGCSARGLHRPFECVSSAFRDQSWLTCCRWNLFLRALCSCSYAAHRRLMSIVVAVFGVVLRSRACD